MRLPCHCGIIVLILIENLASRFLTATQGRQIGAMKYDCEDFDRRPHSVISLLLLLL